MPSGTAAVPHIPFIGGAALSGVPVPKPFRTLWPRPMEILPDITWAGGCDQAKAQPRNQQNRRGIGLSAVALGAVR